MTEGQSWNYENSRRHTYQTYIRELCTFLDWVWSHWAYFAGFICVCLCVFCVFLFHTA